MIKASHSEPDEKTKSEAIALIMAGLGEAELKIVASYTVPIYWTIESAAGYKQIKGGSAFFLDTGTAVFGVTAAHVVSEFFEDTKTYHTHCVIGADGKRPIRFPLGDRIIDGSNDIDIATFSVTKEEIDYTGRTVLKGFVKSWPPRLAQLDGPVTYCGFPGRGRRWLSALEMSFGSVPMCGMVSSAHESCISVLLERENLVRVLGEDEMPENFDFGGMSGGPVLAIVQFEELRFWRPAGVIFSGPNPGNNPDQESISGLEIIRARPIHFIKSDGTLDLQRWQQSNF